MSYPPPPEMEAIFAKHDIALVAMFKNLKARLSRIASIQVVRKYSLEQRVLAKKALEVFDKEMGNKKMDVAARLERLTRIRDIDYLDGNIKAVNHNKRLHLEILLMEKNVIEEYETFETRADEFEGLNEEKKAAIMQSLTQLDKNVQKILEAHTEKEHSLKDPQPRANQTSQEPHWLNLVQASTDGKESNPEPNWSDLIKIARKRKVAWLEKARVAENKEGKEREATKIPRNLKPRLAPKDLETLIPNRRGERDADCTDTERDSNEISELIKNTVQKMVQALPNRKPAEQRPLSSPFARTTASASSPSRRLKPKITITIQPPTPTTSVTPINSKACSCSACAAARYNSIALAPNVAPTGLSPLERLRLARRMSAPDPAMTTVTIPLARLNLTPEQRVQVDELAAAYTTTEAFGSTPNQQDAIAELTRASSIEMLKIAEQATAELVQQCKDAGIQSVEVQRVDAQLQKMKRLREIEEVRGGESAVVEGDGAGSEKRKKNELRTKAENMLRNILERCDTVEDKERAMKFRGLLDELIER